MNYKMYYLNKTKRISFNIAWKILINTYFILSTSKYIIYNTIPYIYKSFFKRTTSNIQVINKANNVYNINISNNLNTLLKYKLPNNFSNKIKDIEYDFILYKHNNNNNNDPIYIVRYNKLNELLYNNLHFNKSNIEFLIIILNYKSIQYNINLKNNNENYYIINNILDYEFVIFYMQNNYNLILDRNENYTLTILDNNCKDINLDKNKYIIFNESDYTIIDKLDNTLENNMLENKN